MLNSFFRSGIQYLRSLNQRSTIALMATVVSVCALCLSIYQVRLARKQQLASVWPYLSIGGHSTTNAAQQTWGITVTNDGLGPAIVESVLLRYAGKTYKYRVLVDSLASWTGQLDSLKNMNYAMSSIDRGSVIRSGSSIEWLSFDLTFSQPPEGQPKAGEFIENLEICIRYKSLYGEVWESTFNDPKREEAVRKIE